MSHFNPPGNLYLKTIKVVEQSDIDAFKFHEHNVNANRQFSASPPPPTINTIPSSPTLPPRARSSLSTYTKNESIASVYHSHSQSQSHSTLPRSTSTSTSGTTRRYQYNEGIINRTNSSSTTGYGHGLNYGYGNGYGYEGGNEMSPNGGVYRRTSMPPPHPQSRTSRYYANMEIPEYSTPDHNQTQNPSSNSHPEQQQYQHQQPHPFRDTAYIPRFNPPGVSTNGTTTPAPTTGLQRGASVYASQSTPHLLSMGGSRQNPNGSTMGFRTGRLSRNGSYADAAGSLGRRKLVKKNSQRGPSPWVPSQSQIRYGDGGCEKGFAKNTLWEQSEDRGEKKAAKGPPKGEHHGKEKGMGIGLVRRKSIMLFNGIGRMFGSRRAKASA